MTLDEAVALLREARDYVGFLSTRPDAIEKALSIQRRIDAALASHDSEPEAVEWVEYSDGDLMAYPGDGNILAVRKQEDGRWQWNTEIDREEAGVCATADEAKAAALRAARSAR